MIKKPTYELIKRQGHFELRQYQSFSMIEAFDQDLRSYQGFRLAFNYIQGENETGEKISMTAPVINQINDQGIQTTSFVMPPQMDHAQVPLPSSKNLQKIFVPKQLRAVYRFRFNPQMELVREFEKELRDWIKKEGYTIVGSLQLARYNPPFIPGLLKKNELWFDVVKNYNL